MSRRRPGPRGRRHTLIDLTGKDLDGCRTVVGRAPTPPKSAEAWWCVRCRVTGAEEDRASSQIRRGLAGDCRSCANRGAHKITRALVEVLVLGAEVPRLRVTRVQVALGWTRSKTLVVLGNATRKRLTRLADDGRFYEVAPAGFDVLRDIAEGRRADRWGQRSRIVAALDGGRASGRRTLLVGTARGESRGSVLTQPPRFALIGCSKTKAPRATVAAALYRGDLFRRAMEYARLRGLMTAILSAEYGLVHLDRVIAPYDTTLSAMSAHARERWSLKVAAQVLDMVPNGAGVVLLCGELYRAPFERGLILRPYEVPMRGLGIGHQRAWLARETARLAAERGAA